MRRALLISRVLSWVAAGATVTAVAAAVAVADTAPERASLAAQRQASSQAFDQEEQACRNRFAANDCANDVQARRRDALAPVRARELGLADQERQQRAAERRRTLANKKHSAAQRPADSLAPTVTPVPVPVLTVRQLPPPPRHWPTSAAQVRKADVAATRQAEAAQRAQAASTRQAQIDVNQQRVAQRVAARASQGKAVQPLPPLPVLPVLPASQPAR